MKTACACLLFLCCSTPADCGVFNVLWTPQAVQLARIDAKAAKTAMRHEARQNARQRTHAERSGYYAPLNYSYSRPATVNRYQYRVHTFYRW